MYHNSRSSAIQFRQGHQEIHSLCNIRLISVEQRELRCFGPEHDCHRMVHLCIRQAVHFRQRRSFSDVILHKAVSGKVRGIEE